MSVRSERALDGLPMHSTDMIESNNTGVLSDHVNATISAAQTADSALGEANSISTNHPDHPLRRTLVCNIRASLSDLCLRRQKATWAPSGEALRAMLQCAARTHTRTPARTHAHTHARTHTHTRSVARQKKFTSLEGTSESVGDLKSIVLHDMTLSAASSDFSVRTSIFVSNTPAHTHTHT